MSTLVATQVRPAWLTATLDRLRAAAGQGVGYAADGPVASEPTALAAMALALHGFAAEATKLGALLAQWQTPEGSLGVRPGEPKPEWPTSLAMVAWRQLTGFETNIARAKARLLATHGEAAEQTPEFGHDTTLVGWSWADKTHSWMEPTAFAVLALRAVGEARNARVREAVRLLEDRLLASGGCNYGNTTVLGQELRAHVQPTGLVMLALAGESHHPKIHKSLEWLTTHVAAETTPASLGWGLLGLKAHDIWPKDADQWLAQAVARVAGRDHSSAKLALLALAAKGWPA